MSTTTVKIGQQTFYGEDQQTAGVLQFSSLSDWYSLTESKSTIIERPLGHGAYGIGYDYRRSSAHTLEGWGYGDTWTEVLTMIDAMHSNMASNVNRTLTFTDDLGAFKKMVSVRAIKITEDKEFNWLTFTIDMVAANPVKIPVIVS